MYQRLLKLPKTSVQLDAEKRAGPLELWRHTIGHGGINSLPLPDGVIKAARKLKPRLIRTFLQEFLEFYPEHGRFDWSRADAYLESLRRTGAEIVASVCFKPKPLFPQVDPRIWQPNNVAEWQSVIRELVRRYSIDRKWITYWEIGNETDIGENGGCPYLIPDAKQFLEYYRITIEPIEQLFPEGRIGGPGAAFSDGDFFREFIRLCFASGTRLDFVSWHQYYDDPETHRSLIRDVNELLTVFGKRPETMITEWNKYFDPVSVEELAHMPRRAAAVAACVIAMQRVKPDWTFYYHVWDQFPIPAEFSSFFKDYEIMHVHWNDIPHRFGLFGVSGEVRPQYFVYWMLNRMDGDEIIAECPDPDLWICSSAAEDRWCVLISNYRTEGGEDKLVELRFANLPSVTMEWTVYRIDEARRWSDERLEMTPTERRKIHPNESGSFHPIVYCPADSVTMAMLYSQKG